MLKKRITVRGVDEEAIEMLREIKEDEGRFMGRVLEDAVREYWSARYVEDGTCEDLE